VFFTEPRCASFDDGTVLHHMDRMLNFRPHARLEMLQFFEHARQLVLGQRLALGALHSHVPRYGLVLVLFAFLNTLIAGVAKRRDFAIRGHGTEFVRLTDSRAPVLRCQPGSPLNRNDTRTRGRPHLEYGHEQINRARVELAIIIVGGKC